MVNTVVHAYPWDLVGDPAAAERIAGLRVDAVAVAASYHTVRAATPLHPKHWLVDARHAAFYLPARRETWSGQRLAPARPSWVDGENSFGVARDALRAAGLPVYAWTVLTHSSRLGSANPDLAVRNAFGDGYPYALCTAQPEVAQYCQTLVREVVEVGRPDGVVLEACGPLGFVHGGHHEKTDGADWGPVHQQLLSLCFCGACANRYEQGGIDVNELRTLVRAAVDSERAPASMVDALGAQLAGALSSVRTGVVRELRQLLVGEIRRLAPSTRIMLHANANEWATGPFATVAPAIDADIDVLVVTCWPGPQQSIPGIKAVRELAGAGKRVAGYVLALPPRIPDGAALAEEWVGYREAGADELHIYHAGLASQARLTAITEAVKTLAG